MYYDYDGKRYWKRLYVGTMCGGSLEIEAREAGGTRVTAFIPLDVKR